MYTQEITRKHRTAFVIAIDRSASMQEMTRMGRRRITKAQAVTLIASSLMQEFIDRCRRTDSLRNYYDIAIVGYGDDSVEMLLGDEGFVAINRLAERQATPHKISFEIWGEGGCRETVEQEVPLWFEPKAAGNTPLYEALVKIKDIVHQWCCEEQNAESFPPIIINITDGEFSDCCPNDLRDIAASIRHECTHDGEVLLLNIHLSHNNDLRSLIFPTTEELVGADAATRFVAELSSTMPRIFHPAIAELKGKEHKAPYKAMGYNANIVELISILNIGSRSGPSLQ